MNVGEFENAEALVPTIKEGLKKYEAKVNKARVLAFQYNIMIMYFIMHKFSEALKWSNIILDTKTELKQEIFTSTTVLLPVIHFELGHHDLVESLTRSAYRTLSKRNRLHSFEKALVKYLRKMPFSTNSVDFQTKLVEFESELTKIGLNESTKYYGMEEMTLWVRSYTEKKKMNQLLQKQ
jgi:hypothetical protein